MPGPHCHEEPAIQIAKRLGRAAANRRDADQHRSTARTTWCRGFTGSGFNTCCAAQRQLRDFLSPLPRFGGDG